MKRKRSRPSPRWREFERLVEQIEQWIAPIGAQIMSPDRIRDKHTGGLREVDAAIRLPGVSGSSLIVLECRARSRAGDVTWIEQLAAKRDAIGADRIIAVSNRAFGNGACRKARSLNVELRRVEELTQAVVERWGWHADITWETVGFHLLFARLNVSRKTGCSEPTNAVREAIRGGTLDASIGIDLETGAALALRLLAETVLAPDKHLVDDPKGAAGPTRRTFVVGLQPGRYGVFSTGGLAPLVEAELTLDVWWETRRAAPARLFSYRSPDGEIVEVARASMPLQPGRRIDIVYSNQPPGIQSEPLLVQSA